MANVGGANRFHYQLKMYNETTLTSRRASYNNNDIARAISIPGGRHTQIRYREVNERDKRRCERDASLKIHVKYLPRVKYVLPLIFNKEKRH